MTTWRSAPALAAYADHAPPALPAVGMAHSVRPSSRALEAPAAAPARLERARGVGAFVLEPQILEAKLRFQPAQAKPWSSPLAQVYLVFLTRDRQELAIPPQPRRSAAPRLLRNGLASGLQVIHRQQRRTALDASIGDLRRIGANAALGALKRNKEIHSPGRILPNQPVL